MFSTNMASASLLNTLQVNGQVPSRKTWNWEQAQDRIKDVYSTNTMDLIPTTFGLKVKESRDWRNAARDKKKRDMGVDPLAPIPPLISEQRASLKKIQSAPDFSKDPNAKYEAPPLTRADKYYQCLLLADKKRGEYYIKQEWDDKQSMATNASLKAKKITLKRENAKVGIYSDSESDPDEDDLIKEQERDFWAADFGPLQAFPGIMKVEVDVVVLRPPGEKDSDEESTEASSEAPTLVTPTASEAAAEEQEAAAAFAAAGGGGKGGKGGGAGGAGGGEDDDDDDDEDEDDWEKELQALQEQFAEPEKEEEEDNESLPDGLFGKQMGNVHDNLAKRTALGLGGTAFFVPDVERYALQPSLLPPPPRGLGYLLKTGHRRLKIRPRLPLEVSRNRWRDERPYGCPVEPEFSPSVDDMHAFEEKVRRVELYGTLTNIIREMPKPDGVRTDVDSNDLFERSLDYQLKDSLAWKQYIMRQRLIELGKKNKKNPSPESKGDQMLTGYKAMVIDDNKKKKKVVKKNEPEKKKPGVELSGRPETGAYRNLPVSHPVLDEKRGDYLCTPPSRGIPCQACEARGFWHDMSDGIPHETAWDRKCGFCKRCETCRGRGAVMPAKLKPVSHLVSVPPLKMGGTSPFTVGYMCPKGRACKRRKPKHVFVDPAFDVAVVRQGEDAVVLQRERKPKSGEAAEAT